VEQIIVSVVLVVIKKPWVFTGDPEKMINFVFKPGDKVAQLILYPLIQANVQWTEEVSETARGEKGFGSSDKK
jgi:hypothetical protein